MAKWKEKTTPKGVLKYRMPNIAEGYFYLSAITSIKINTMGDAFTIKGTFIPQMKELIDFSGLGYESYDDFLEDLENNFIPTKEIADEIFIAVTSVLGKKP